MLIGTPSESPISVARSTPAASITARTSSMRCSSGGASATGSDIPVPRRSKSTTRPIEAMRLNALAHASLSQNSSKWLTKPGTTTRSRSPSPKT